MRSTLRRLCILNKKAKRRDRMTPSEFDEMNVLLKEVGDALGSVTDDYARFALTEKYINAKTWRRVADELGVLSEDTVRKACSRAVDKYFGS